MRLTDGTRMFEGVLAIPEGEVGTYRVRHIKRAAGEFELATQRSAIMGGQRMRKVRIPHPSTWHELSYEKGVWMTDLPIEQEQHDNLLEPVLSGSVLVGGLGLGYAATVLAQRRGIRRVVVVEKSPEVVALVEDALRENLGERASAKLEIVCADLHAYLRARKGHPPFTWAFYDIWQLDSESTFFDTVVPLLSASEGVVKNRPLCWNEDVMRGQLYFGLVSRLHPLPDAPGPEAYAENIGNKWHDWRVPFFKWVVEAKPELERAFEGARVYVTLYGIHRTWLEGWRAWCDDEERRVMKHAEEASA